MEKCDKGVFSAEESLAWLKTEEGAEHFKKCMENAEAECERRQKESENIDRRVWFEPMTL